MAAIGKADLQNRNARGCKVPRVCENSNILSGQKIFSHNNPTIELILTCVTVESSTVVNRGGMNTQVTVKESLSFKFDESKTYYVAFKEYQRSVMQGTSYIPYSITEDVARNLASKLNPIGQAVAAPL